MLEGNVKDKIEKIRKAIAKNRNMDVIEPLTLITDLIEEAALGHKDSEIIPKEEVEATLTEVKDKVDDLLDDGKLNGSNKKGKKAKK